MGRFGDGRQRISQVWRSMRLPLAGGCQPRFQVDLASATPAYSRQRTHRIVAPNNFISLAIPPSTFLARRDMKMRNRLFRPVVVWISPPLLPPASPSPQNAPGLACHQVWPTVLCNVPQSGDGAAELPGTGQRIPPAVVITSH